MQIWNEPSTKSVFMNARPGFGASASSVVDTPRNAYAAVQVVVRFLENVTVTGISAAPDTAESGRKIKLRIFRQEYTISITMRQATPTGSLRSKRDVSVIRFLRTEQLPSE